MEVIIMAVVAAAVILVIWYISTSNSIKTLELKVKEGESGIDVALTKRYDTLTKMMDVAKGYMSYEQQTMVQLVQLRNGMTMNERNAVNKNMDEVEKQIKFTAENYPELKSSNNFMTLQAAIADVEEHLQAARRLYNANVNAYNAKIVVFPNSIVAGSMKAEQKQFFEAENSKKNDVKISF